MIIRGPQIDLPFDLTDVDESAITQRMSAEAITQTVTSLDVELVECPTCGGEGEVFVDRWRGDHTTLEKPCPECCEDNEAALETWAELRAERDT